MQRIPVYSCCTYHRSPGESVCLTCTDDWVDCLWCCWLDIQVYGSSNTIASGNIMQCIPVYSCCPYNRSPRQSVCLSGTDYRIERLGCGRLNGQVYGSPDTIAPGRVMQCISIYAWCVHNGSAWQIVCLTCADNWISCLQCCWLNSQVYCSPNAVARGGIMQCVSVYSWWTDNRSPW